MTQISDLDRFQALDLLVVVQKLMDESRYGSAMLMVGMTEAAFPSNDSNLQELMDAFKVRLADLMRRAGVRAE